MIIALAKHVIRN